MWRAAAGTGMQVCRAVSKGRNLRQEHVLKSEVILLEALTLQDLVMIGDGKGGCVLGIIFAPE